MATAIKIVNKPIEEIIGYGRNARTHNEKQLLQIVASIKEYGWTNPILVDENNVIIAGHGRIEAAARLALTDVPCIVLRNLTENQKKAYRIADNQIPLNAGWDEELLSAELAELAEEDYNVDMIGFSQEELNKLLEVDIPAGGVEIPFETDESRSGVKLQYVGFDGHKIPITEDEAEQFAARLDKYVEETGAYFGFIDSLMRAK
uniref:ParB domain protein nuclease n=1 Tax=Serratia proteamaculans (strain 568) TaxID=399741 RepID=A8GLM9_SERP5